jgi:FRG domain-containing protein
VDRLSDTIWPGEVIASWENLTNRAAQIAERQVAGETVILRGQPEQWTLAPGLLRSVPKGISYPAVLQAEINAMVHFRSQSHLYMAPGEREAEDIYGSGDLAWWTLMQHYGAPTRLLDWTASPYVAAYFAAEQSPNEDGAVLVVDAGRLNGWAQVNNRKFRQGVVLAAGDPIAIQAFTPARKTQRLAAQQGYFTVAGHPQKEHDELLEEAGAIVRRWVIPAQIKPSILAHLRVMNVSALTLFPGLDGLGRTVRELIRATPMI